MNGRLNAVTLNELKEELSKVEETLLIELLGLNSSQIVEEFEYLIVEKFEELENEIDSWNV